MRNTTKLKQILSGYDMEFTMTDEGEFKIFMTDKRSVEQPVYMIEGKTYSGVLAKAYSIYLKKKAGK
jgi:hypothetical protein